ncbi:uncharacterized protein LOC129589533 [Paramacrobiotus metropolitanus]|uniref:uncharacterized protein LOC129589533 n=1 Tax=Paramacrobiotus metropolitanus TaxID=2943436 RepID=UPI002445696D|nr:uncharacterized protein LOC129589533 [Paramacrobiotus metropolitanus]
MKISIYFIVARALCCCIIACSVKSGLRRFTRKEIQERLDAAISGNLTGTVFLGNLTNPSHPPDPLANSVLIKAAEGAPVTFPCHDDRANRPNGDGHNLVVGWKDMEFTRTSPVEPARPVISCGCRNFTSRIVGFDVFEYNDTFVSVKLNDFSQANTGRYECRWYDGADVFVSQRYVVSAKFSARQLFTPPMHSVSAKIGERVELRCYVKFDKMAGDLPSLFMWTNERDFLMASYAEHLHHAVRYRKGIIWWMAPVTGACYMALIIPSMTLDDAGRYRCWFRVDAVLEEWLVQSAYITVTE